MKSTRGSEFAAELNVVHILGKKKHHNMSHIIKKTYFCSHLKVHRQERSFFPRSTLKRYSVFTQSKNVFVAIWVVGGGRKKSVCVSG